MDNGKDESFARSIYFYIVIAIFLFGIGVIVFSVMLKWEAWMIPVIIALSVMNWILFLMNRVTVRAGSMISGCSLIFLVFYYCSKAVSVYYCSVIILLMVVLFIYTYERILIWGGTVAGLAGILYNLASSYLTGEKAYDTYEILSISQVFIIIPLAIILILCINKAVLRETEECKQKIETLTRDNEKAYDFLSNVSHELRTPVNAIIGISGIMQKEEHTPQTMDRLNAISVAGHRVSEQIRDILDYSEIDTKTLVVNNEAYMISSVISELIAELSVSENYGLELIVDIDPHTPSVLKGDASKIKRILWQLIRNGYKYTREGGVYLYVHPRRRDYGINLILEVDDTGIGMNEEEVESVYDRFYQADSSRARTAGGIGLGIPVVNGLAESMRGVLSIESREGQGTRAIVSIPQEVEDDTPCMVLEAECVVAGFLGFVTTGSLRIRDYYMEMIGRLARELPVEFHRVLSRRELEKLTDSLKITHLFVGTGEYLENRDYIDGLSQKMNVALVADLDFEGNVGNNIAVFAKPFYGMQIMRFLNDPDTFKDNRDEGAVLFPDLKTLVVDDEHLNLIVAEEIFSGYGMKVSCCESGKEALERCMNEDYDIVFMDHMMPEMDGVEAMHRIRQALAKKNRETIIIALTANASSMAKDMLLKEGFDGFIPKPIQTGELEGVLMNLLPQSAVRSDAKAGHNMNGGSENDSGSGEKEEKTGTKRDPFEILENAGVNTVYALSCCGNVRPLYMDILREYADESAEKKGELVKAFEARDFENYTIRIHGLKSTSRLIGAESVSALAAGLEEAAKSGDEEKVKKLQEEFMPGYEALVEAIKIALSEA